MSQYPVLTGITREEIVKILEEAVAPFKPKGGSMIVFMDTSYLYQFEPEDVPLLNKMCSIIPYDFSHAYEWLRTLERWYSDQTVRDHFGRIFKPRKILRAIDKVPGEGLALLMQGFVGRSGDSFNWHGLGKGVDLEKAYFSDTMLVDEIERIDVWDTPGGSLSSDGVTVVAVGNHAIDMPGSGENVTESALFNIKDVTKDLMGNHSIFPAGIPHTQGQDALGETTSIFGCSV